MNPSRGVHLSRRARSAGRDAIRPCAREAPGHLRAAGVLDGRRREARGFSTRTPFRRGWFRFGVMASRGRRVGAKLHVGNGLDFAGASGRRPRPGRSMVRDIARMRLRTGSVPRGRGILDPLSARRSSTSPAILEDREMLGNGRGARPSTACTWQTQSPPPSRSFRMRVRVGGLQRQFEIMHGAPCQFAMTV